jgi:hypothetical protein
VVKWYPWQKSCPSQKGNMPPSKLPTVQGTEMTWTCASLSYRFNKAGRQGPCFSLHKCFQNQCLGHAQLLLLTAPKRPRGWETFLVTRLRGLSCYSALRKKTSSYIQGFAWSVFKGENVDRNESRRFILNFVPIATQNDYFFC